MLTCPLPLRANASKASLLLPASTQARSMLQNILQQMNQECALQGTELTTKDEDFLATKPKLLLAVVDTVLEAYEAQTGKVYETGKTSMVGQAAELMHPQVIDRMRSLKAELIKHFL
jgi:hypothetical protein